MRCVVIDLFSLTGRASTAIGAAKQIPATVTNQRLRSERCCSGCNADYP
jgi:hypothetical protein